MDLNFPYSLSISSFKDGRFTVWFILTTLIYFASSCSKELLAKKHQKSSTKQQTAKVKLTSEESRAVFSV